MDNQIKHFRLVIEPQKFKCETCQDDIYHTIEQSYVCVGAKWSMIMKAQCIRCRTVTTKELIEK